MHMGSSLHHLPIQKIRDFQKFKKSKKNPRIQKQSNLRPGVVELGDGVFSFGILRDVFDFFGNFGNFGTFGNLIFFGWCV